MWKLYLYSPCHTTQFLWLFRVTNTIAILILHHKLEHTNLAPPHSVSIYYTSCLSFVHIKLLHQANPATLHTILTGDACADLGYVPN